MVDFFKLSAVSKKRHLELVEEKSDIYDSPEEVYGLNYQEKILGGNGSSASPYKIEVSIQNTSGIDFEGIGYINARQDILRIMGTYEELYKKADKGHSPMSF